LNNVVTSTLVFAGEGKIEEYVGGYDDWLRQREISQIPLAEKTQKKPPAKVRPATLKMTFKEERELEALPEMIKRLEEEKKQIYQALADPAFYRAGGSAAGIANSRLQALEKELTAAYLRWEYLEERQGQTQAVKK
jgi:ATP-binding cassette subfamily F protein uup